MRITYKIALEIIGHEAIIRQAYKDSVGVWTWGVGVTNASGHNVERYIGEKQSMEKVLSVYIWLLEEKYAPSVRAAFEGHDLTEQQFAAALSFHWNTGAIRRASWVKHFNNGKMAASKKAFMNFSKPKAIIPRRRAERDLFFEGTWTAQGKALEYTRVHPSGSPNWKSAKNVDITAALKEALGGQENPLPIDVPDIVEAPTPPSNNFWANLIRAISTLFGKDKS